ncbi:hypothetical protein [Phyllobacterium chamaecytisi]|uniref:hypothetical protein n=1 Tax=Phyllobacterium chamaecytisi TaxID=2876082 RepID=UPI001CC98D1B|nr:hypothetical protein [Phyllobacterium sp. KW56]MBZ9603069.1 hypothetical protein [Phyllobacterium sp. KW56]
MIADRVMVSWSLKWCIQDEHASAGPYKAALIEINPLWGQHDVWSLLNRGRSAYTAYYLLRSVDYQYGPDSQIVASPPQYSVFRDVFLRTLGISIGVTAATLLLGFPVAYLLATLPPQTSNLLMIMVVVPFWISALARTTAWVVLLQEHGANNVEDVFDGQKTHQIERLARREASTMRGNIAMPIVKGENDSANLSHFSKTAQERDMASRFC